MSNFFSHKFEQYSPTLAPDFDPIVEKNLHSVPYIDLLRWGFVFFREEDPFQNYNLAIANKPCAFLQDAKTTKGEKLYHANYVEYFFDRVNKNSPTNHELVKIGERVEEPHIKERDNIKVRKYIINNVPKNLSSEELSYIKNRFDDFHSFSLPLS